MKVIGFEAALNADDSLGVPADVARQLPRDRQLRVVVLLPESSQPDAEEETDWQRLASEQFLRGYGDSDSVYDTPGAR